MTLPPAKGMLRREALLCGFLLFAGWVGAASGASIVTAAAAPCLPGQSVAVENAEGRIYDSNKNGSYADATDMRYRVFLPPGYDPSVSYPVVLWLHGLGAEGTNNLDQLAGDKSKVLQLLEGDNRYNYPCILVAPQRTGSLNNSSTQWYGNHKSEVFGILTDVAAQYSINRNRIYLTGVSWGAMGSYAFLANRSAADPFQFAAAVVIAGSASQSSAAAKLSTLKGFPLWVFHASNDPTVPIYSNNGTDVVVDTIRKFGGAPIYTRYADGWHTTSVWDSAFGTPALLPWLMAQRLDNAATGQSEITGTEPSVIITGYRVGAALDLEGELAESSGQTTEVSWWNSMINGRSASATVTTNWTKTVTFSSGSFTSADIGSRLFLNDAGKDNWNGYKITGVSSPTQVTVESDIASGTFSSYEVNPPGHRRNPKPASGLGVWTANGIALAQGANVIGVAGKTSSFAKGTLAGSTFLGGDRITVNFTSPSGDVEPPVLTAGSPQIVTADASITLIGTASDNVGVSAVGWATDHGSAGTASGTNTWSAGPIPLDPGNNIVTVTARDAVGNIAVKIIHAMYNKPPLAPSVSATTAGNTGVTIDIMTPGSDPDAQPQIRSISGLGAPSHGTASVYGPAIRYLPTAGYHGPDNFSYNVTDGATEATGQISITVTGSTSTQEAVFFAQDFSLSGTPASYAAVNPASGQFDNLSTSAAAGTWSVDAGGRLKLVRAAASTAGAGLTRFTGLGTPEFVKLAFDFSLTGGGGYSTTAVIELGNLTAAGDYLYDSADGLVQNKLAIIEKGTGMIAFNVGGLTSPLMPAVGATCHVAWYVNASTQSQTYPGPDGFLYQVGPRRSSLWVDGMLLWDNIARSANLGGPGISGFRFRFPTPNAIAFTLDNMTLAEQSYAFVADPISALNSWRQFHGLASDGSQDGESPANDGVQNILKFALNMAPNAGDLSRPASGVMPADGNSGLPRMDVDAVGDLVFSFVRRKAAATPGILYTVETSGDLTTWLPCAEVPLLEEIDGNWEKAHYTLHLGSEDRGFLRLSVKAE